MGRSERIDTGGGAYVGAGVHMGGGDFIGRDRILYGDEVYGDKITVKLYAPTVTDPQALMDREAEAWREFLMRSTRPYRGLAPFTYEDRFLFTGRDADIERVVRHVGQNQLLVLYGVADVGKTSLLSAGVIPRLRQQGALFVLVADYARAAADIRAKLVQYADEVELALPPNPSLPELARTLVTTRQQGLVLILDQFERFFEPDPEARGRTTLMQDLQQMLTTLPPGLMRAVIVIREDARGRLDELAPYLPGLWQASVSLLPLDREGARQAIEHPLEVLDHQPFYADDVVESRLLPDLAALAPGRDGRILPAELQIVCDRLYQAARDRDTRRINAQLYEAVSDGKGAEGLLLAFLGQKLDTALAGQRDLTAQILGAMVDPALSFWVAPQDLSIPDVDLMQVQGALNRMVKAGLLILRVVDERWEYAFASHSIAQAALRRAGPQAQARYRAQGELARVWAAWLERDALADRAQLRLLAESGAHLTPGPVQVLLLLESAVARDTPREPWLSRLEGMAAGVALVRQLETPEDPALRPRASRTTQSQARRLLGLEDPALPSRVASDDFGPVAWAAANHPQSIQRQTAALALAAVYGTDALARLDQAVVAGEGGGGRRAELRGALADAAPQFARENVHLPRRDRLRVGSWRVRRRLVRDRRRLVGWTLGGAVGAGLGLGLLRASIALLAGGLLVGVQFALYFYYGAILGAALCLGMALADALCLRSPGAAVKRATGRAERPSPFLVVGLGTLFFGVAHIGVMWINGGSLVKAPLVAPLGFLFGLGLSGALYAQPEAGGRARVALALAVLVAMLTQLIFILVEGKGLGISIAWPGTFYRAHLSDSVQRWWPDLAAGSVRWPDILGVLDAALVGGVMVTGIKAGLRVAADWLRRWRDLVRRAGE